MKGDLKGWHDENEADSATITQWYESISLYQQYWNERFQDNGLLEMFKFFSMSLFRKQVTSIEEAQLFGDHYQVMLADYYCEEVSFTATYPEAMGKVFTAVPLGDRSTFERHCRYYKRYLWRNFMGKNSQGENWKTGQVLLRILSSQDDDVLSWLPKDSVLRHSMKSCLIQVVSSSDVERVMSTFNLYDDKLNQAAKPKTVEQMIIIMKESPSWRKFDTPMSCGRSRKHSAGKLFHP